MIFEKENQKERAILFSVTRLTKFALCAII